MFHLRAGILLTAMLVAWNLSAQEADTASSGLSDAGEATAAVPAPPTPSPAAAAAIAPQAPSEPPGGKRVFGVLPNYRTADASQEGTVLPARMKMRIASKDSFDYPLVMLGGFFAGIGQWSGSQPSFGQGMKGFGHRLLTNYTDQASGNLLTEGVFPVLLHQDPRYFRRGTGTVGHRTAYALSRVILTHKDSGGTTFNYSEWLGNAGSVAISNAYNPDTRTFADNGAKLLMQVGTDAVSQVLKEFWPDIRRKLFRNKGTDANATP